MKINLRCALVGVKVALCFIATATDTQAQSCTKTSKGLERCITELDGGSMTIDSDPINKRPVARYLTFERSSPPSSHQMKLLASTMVLLGVPDGDWTKISKLWLQCMNEGDTIGAVETNGMTWSFSNPIDDICGIDILIRKERGRAY